MHYHHNIMISILHWEWRLIYLLHFLSFFMKLLFRKIFFLLSMTPWYSIYYIYLRFIARLFFALGLNWAWLWYLLLMLSVVLLFKMGFCMYDLGNNVCMWIIKIGVIGCEINWSFWLYCCIWVSTNFLGETAWIYNTAYNRSFYPI